MKQYRIASLARDDLVDIWSYIAQDKPRAADRQIDTFLKKFQLLAKNPELGERRPEFAGGDYRSFSAGKYVIFYRLVDRGIEIARVLHGARDLTDLG